MPLAPLTEVPTQIQAGDTCAFYMSFTDFPVASYTLSFVIAQGTAAPVTIAAATSGSQFLVTIPKATTAALAAGLTQWIAYATAMVTLERYQADAGVLNVLPNLAVTQTPTFAQAQVTLLKVVIAQFNSTTNRVVDFQGQRFERFSIADYQKQLLYWEGRVAAEQAKLSAALGGTDTGRVAIRFVQ